MAIDKSLFGPQSEEENEIFALEALVVSVQVALHRAMTKHGVSNKELAERLGMSPARVSQIFSDKGPNMTLRTIAKIQAALGEEFELLLKSDLDKRKISRKESVHAFAVLLQHKPASLWHDSSAHNNNRNINSVAA
jgi:transcriptional regulator with XRE-family HTH domain